MKRGRPTGYCTVAADSTTTRLTPCAAASDNSSAVAEPTARGASRIASTSFNARVSGFEGSPATTFASPGSTEWDGSRVTATTLWPSASSRSTAVRPTLPVAPVTKNIASSSPVPGETRPAHASNTSSTSTISYEIHMRSGVLLEGGDVPRCPSGEGAGCAAEDLFDVGAHALFDRQRIADDVEGAVHDDGLGHELQHLRPGLIAALFDEPQRGPERIADRLSLLPWRDRRRTGEFVRAAGMAPVPQDRSRDLGDVGRV